ncbi:LysR family transcriptional regulator [Burkholderia alba]|uniref:LysR family transcriptional regulator n=1 Tax=Burkholderia alba TaxID=2683677 RepID=UPI002B05355F|nr:LysR family transcriptional regulator [Burkholderia alba]
MNLRFLETFIWVATLRSFSLAADKLNTTQAAVSSRISALEDDLGTKLFTRDPKGIALTQAGERVLKHAEQVSTSIAQLRASLRDDTLAFGNIRMGAMESAIHSWFIDFVTDVASRYPNLDIEIVSDTALNLNEKLRRGMLDIVIQTDMLRDETIRSLELMTLPLGWIATPELTRRHAGDTLRTLGHARLITFSRHSRPHQDLLRLMQSHGIGDAKVCCVNSVTAMIRLTQAGFGIAAMPAAFVPDLLDRDALRILDVRDTPPPMPFVIAWRAGADWSERLVALALESTHRYQERLACRRDLRV